MESMSNRRKIDRILVWTTLSFFIALAIGTLTLKESEKPISIDLIDQPMIGDYNANVEVIVFEDFMCKECQFFYTNIMPQLKENYIDPGYISLKLVPLAFFPYSEKVSQAAFCIYQQSHSAFWSFLELWFASSPEFHIDKTIDEIVKSLSIDQIQYHQCMQTQNFHQQLEENMRLAEKMIEPEVEVPAIFINGKRSLNYSYSAISREIERQLKKGQL